jgi:hypothetical protein
LASDPGADRIVAAGQEPSVVSVQALHAHTRTTNSAVRARTGVCRGEVSVALGRVATVSVGDRYGIQLGLRSANGTGRLEATDG